MEIVSPKIGKYCPTTKAEDNISPTERKQFPVVTDIMTVVVIAVIQSLIHSCIHFFSLPFCH